MAKMTRRLLLAAAAAPPLMAQQQQTIGLPRKLRVGMIGFASGTHYTFALRPLPSLPDIEIVAIQDESAEVLERQARNPFLAKAKRFSNYNEMLDGEKLDLVVINNNNGERAAAVLACAKRKIDVIAEKPLAITRPDYIAVKKAVLESNIKLGMLLDKRFLPHFLTVRQAVADGLIGDVGQVASQKSYVAGTRPEWFKNKATYGSTMLWIGPHVVDLMRWSSGQDMIEAASFHGHVGFPELRDMDTTSGAIFKLANGGTAIMRMDYYRSAATKTHEDDRLRVAGTKGIVEFQASTGVTLMTSEKAPEQIPMLPAKSVFIDFLEGAYLGKEPSLTLADIWRVNEIAISAHEAAESGKIVKTIW